MENKKVPIFTMLVVALIVGSALYKQIDFKTMTVEKPALAILYTVTLLFAIFVFVKNFRKKAEK
jgi:prepilin signal peptidase PulO-like enzyme (type II secretory pathway)